MVPGTSCLFSRARAALTVALIPAAAAWAQPEAATPATPAAGQPAAVAPKPPYVGQIQAKENSRVYARGGPGTVYYPVAILQSGAEVIVTEDDGVWKQLVPPADCFSLIAKEFVELRNAEAASGTVTGENVNVRAGPVHGDLVKDPYRVQCSLGSGTAVTILGTWTGTLDGEQKTFYKIVPPPAARVYVLGLLCRFLRPYQAAQTSPTAGAGAQAVRPADTSATQFANLETALVAACNRPAVDQIDPDELARLSTHYQEVANVTRDPKVRVFAEYRVKWIGQRIALIAALAKAKSAAEAIDQRRAAGEGTAPPILPTGQESPAESRFTETGRVEIGVYTEIEPNRFRLVGAGPRGVERTLCYVEAVPGGPDLRKLLGKRVGVIGTRNFVPSFQQHLIYVREAEVLDEPAPQTRPAEPDTETVAEPSAQTPPTDQTPAP
jgi:hypothetical protein